MCNLRILKKSGSAFPLDFTGVSRYNFSVTQEVFPYMEQSMDLPQGYQIRPLTTDDLDQYNALLRYAFQVTEQELFDTGWKDEEIKQSKCPVLKRADVLGCFDRETLVSQIAVYPLKANIYASVYPIGFVTSVCTYPEYTGRGIMKRLMYQALVHMRERKQPFGMLFPYSIPLYRRFGWEIISNKISFTVKDRQIPSKAKAPGYVRRVNWENKDFMNLHTRFASSTHGCLFRNSLAWEEYWRWDEDDTVVAVYYDQHAVPMGYMVYLIKDDIMHIKEMIYINREAHEGLWEYIRAHDSMIDEVRGNSYFNEPIAFEMDDGDIREMIRPYIMGRIVDVEEFLHLYHCSPEEKGVCFDLDIDDAFLPWNNRPFRVWFEGGNCTLTDRDPDYELRMSIATLSTLLIGYKTAAKLARIGRITGSDEAIARLDKLLRIGQVQILALRLDVRADRAAHVRAFVPVHAAAAQRVVNDLRRAFHKTHLIRVLNAQDEFTPVLPGKQIPIQCRAQSAQMHKARRRRRKSCTHFLIHSLILLSSIITGRRKGRCPLTPAGTLSLHPAREFLP